MFTMQNVRLRIAVVTSLIWISSLSACGATLRIKTWFTDSTQVETACLGQKPFIRRNAEGAITEALTVLQADGYRCYSASDDEAWRDLMKSCCPKGFFNFL